VSFSERVRPAPARRRAHVYALQPPPTDTGRLRPGGGRLPVLCELRRCRVTSPGHLAHTAHAWPQNPYPAAGADGVLSAESLLADPALFWPARAAPGRAWAPADAPGLLLEYLDLVDAHPVPARMIRAHAFRMLGARAPRRARSAPWGLAEGGMHAAVVDRLPLMGALSQTRCAVSRQACRA
jgi:hypothetical protein